MDPITEIKLNQLEAATWPTLYKKIAKVALLHYPEETNDCSVIALASACNVSYGKAQAELARQGRKVGEGATMHMIMAAAHNLGWNVESISTEVMRSMSAPTLARIRNDVAKAATVMAIVYSKGSGHVLTIKDGAIIDYSGSRKCAKYVYAVTPREA